jgi:TetR/AcrR family transcriptional repressor of nem operon
VRRSREETARTRSTAVEAASRLFRERGIESVSVGEVMAAQGMTAGGFYRHFESKEALAAEACAAAFAGCPLPALASDMARQPAAVRRAYTEGVRDALARIEEIAPGTDSRARLALLAGMVGALAIARAVNDEELSAAVLRETRGFWINALEQRS